MIIIGVEFVIVIFQLVGKLLFYTLGGLTFQLEPNCTELLLS